MIDYQIHGVSKKQLKFSYWFLTHKKLLVKIGIGLLILWCVITLGYSIFGLVSWGIEVPKERRMLARLTVNPIDFIGFQQKHQPQSLIITQPQIIYIGNQKYDFIAQVKNPNKDRGVINLSYQFVSGDFSTPQSSIIIPPEQTVFLLSLGNKSEKKLTVSELKINEIKWEGLWKRIKVEEVEITTTQPKFQTGGGSRSWVSFSATNDSLKNIWEVTWQTVLYSGKRIVAVNQITSEQFLTGETREIEISWFERLPKITQIDLVPIVNIYDPSIFFEIPGKAGELYY